MRDFFLMFSVQLLQYFLITANYRMIAKGSYAGTAGTDLVFAAVNFLLIKRIAKSESKGAWIGYTLGGVCGSLAALWVTKRLG